VPATASTQRPAAHSRPAIAGRKHRADRVEDFLQQRIAARNGIADDEQVGRQAGLGGVVALDQFDALSLELGAHRRIDIGIAARHAMAGRPRQQGDAAHEGAADAEDVDVHGGSG
jgi:hypothetical protein